MRATNRSLAEKAFKLELYDSALYFLDEEEIERRDKRLPDLTGMTAVPYHDEANHLLAGYLAAERLGKMRWSTTTNDWTASLAFG